MLNCFVRIALLVAPLMLWAAPARADGDINNVNHIIIVMQENHSFDNYFGVLAYVPGTPYHSARGVGKLRKCPADDHTCVDGLSCKITKTGAIACRNRNPGPTGPVRSFHDPRYCTGPDLDHSWKGTHREANYNHPNDTLRSSRMRGFVKVNAETEGPEQAVLFDTMGFYDDVDLPFYYDIAKTFAMSDRYFCDVLGQTFPNRAYLVAGTSFGHLTTSEIITPGGYKPINGTLYDLLDSAGASWIDYYSDLPYSAAFHTSPGHVKPIAMFAADAAAGLLPDVAFIDPSAFPDQDIGGTIFQTDEHPPFDIRAGQYMVSQVINALRNSPSWNDSVLFYTYDEHGGFYDHVMPPPAPQGGALTPDGIPPGQCADLSNPPTSETPGNGATCNVSRTVEAPAICPSFTPTGPYPADCANFNQLGIRVPFVAVSPFSKPSYVSHTIGSHVSLLAFIEKRFGLPSLTLRDANANTLEDLFDFDTSPSLTAAVGTAPLPMQPGDPGCPFM